MKENWLPYTAMPPMPGITLLRLVMQKFELHAHYHKN